MDWNSIKNSITSLTQKVSPVLEKVRGYGRGVRDFAEKQIHSTPLFLRKQAEYESLQSAKKVILIASLEGSEHYHDFMLHYILYAKDAWAMSAKLRFLDIRVSPDIASLLKIEKDPTMIILYQGFEYKRYTTMEDIKKWWKDPSFYDDNPMEEKEKKIETQVQTPISDPLNEVEKWWQAKEVVLPKKKTTKEKNVKTETLKSTEKKAKTQKSLTKDTPRTPIKKEPAKRTPKK